MKSADDWKPWYRRKEYKGDLNESEKRHLDSFRTMEEHPATSYNSLPNEVQYYVIELDFALAERTEELAFVKLIATIGIGSFLLFTAYHGLYWGNSTLGYILGLAIVSLGFAKFIRDRHRNASEFIIKSKDQGAPRSRIDEGIQRNWELTEIVRLRSSASSNV